MTNSGVEVRHLVPGDTARSDDIQDPSASQLLSDLLKSCYKRVVDSCNVFDRSCHDQTARIDDIQDPSASQLLYDLLKICYKRVLDSCNVFDRSSHDQPTPLQAKIGFVFSCLYFLGSIAIAAYYFTNDRGRPTVVATKYVSAESVHSGSVDDYICSCDLPPEIMRQLDKAEFKNDTRSSTFHRCYDPEDPEQVRSVNVLQFGDNFVSAMIEPINTKRISTRKFNFRYSLYWQSYELQTSGGNPYTKSVEDPLADLSKQLTDRGFILDGRGFISVASLVRTPFFTVPQGFLKADVNFNCTNCSKCGEALWDTGVEYSLGNATETRRRTSHYEDAGSIYCYKTPRVPADGSLDAWCQGSCRSFQTQYEPWGIALSTFANTLSDLIEDPDRTEFSFDSRVLYANVSSFSQESSERNISFLEIEPTGTSWAKLLDYFEDIPDCTAETNSVYICNGTSICQSAAVYSADSFNSESVEVACMNYPVENNTDKGMDQNKCNSIVQTHTVKFRVPDQDISALCGAFACEEVDASEIYWKNLYEFSGEAALSMLVSRPSFDNSYIPALCVNSYSQAHVTYEELEGKQGDILEIFEVNCTSGKSRGCWLTGRHKNLTDTVQDGWKQHTFTRDENKSAEQMFACYRFHKMSVPRFFLDRFGIIGGNIGNLWIAASGVYWLASKCSSSKCLDKYMKCRSRDSDAGSGSALNGTPSAPTAIAHRT